MSNNPPVANKTGKTYALNAQSMANTQKELELQDY